jgi:hypothetical protein
VEEPTPSFAGATARMDFILREHDIGIEAKMTRNGLAEKELGKQLIEDAVRYRENYRCKTLVCFVYDPEHRIINRPGMKSDLQKLSTDEMRVVVCIIG